MKPNKYLLRKSMTFLQGNTAVIDAEGITEWFIEDKSLSVTHIMTLVEGVGIDHNCGVILPIPVGRIDQKEQIGGIVIGYNHHKRWLYRPELGTAWKMASREHIIRVIKRWQNA